MSEEEIKKQIALNCRETAQALRRDKPANINLHCIGCGGPVVAWKAAFVSNTCADCWHRIADAIDPTPRSPT